MHHDVMNTFIVTHFEECFGFCSFKPKKRRTSALDIAVLCPNQIASSQNPKSSTTTFQNSWHKLLHLRYLILGPGPKYALKALPEPKLQTILNPKTTLGKKCPESGWFFGCVP